MSLLVSGSLVYDHIMNFPDSFKNHILPDQIHILNVSFMVDKLERSWGGTAGNIAFTLKLLGANPVIVSALGKDGADYLKYFSELGISTEFIKQDAKQYTASAYITTDADDNQITAFYGGPSVQAANWEIKNVKPKPALALISPNHKDVMIKHLKESAELGIEVVFDPGQQIISFNENELTRMLGQSQFVIGNDYEIKLLRDRTGWDGKKLLSEIKVLITTLGERGSIITTHEGEEIIIKPCPPQSVDDPTGAGDAFRAGFFAGYEKGFDLKTCGQMGAVAGSYAVETYGTQEHTFTIAEFCKRYENTFHDKILL